MKKILQYFSIFCFLIFCLYVLESACYRMVEGYANWRLHFAWGSPNKPHNNKFLAKLPLDHFALQPTANAQVGHLGYWVAQEDGYTRKITSFTRPLRDLYENYILNAFEPLSNFEIRDYEYVKGAVLPGLEKLASIDDVKLRKARRVGDGIEFAKGVFFKIVVDDGAYSYRSHFADLESSFGYLLTSGFACVVLPVSSGEDLIKKVNSFREQETLMAENLFAWADGLAANFLMESCRIEPDLWKVMMITDPDEFVSPPSTEELPWLYFVVDDDRRLKEKGLDLLYEWIDRARSDENNYASRLSGLLRVGQNFQVGKSLPSYFASHIISSSKLFAEMEGPILEEQIFSQFNAEEKTPPQVVQFESSLQSQYKSIGNTDFDLDRIEDLINNIEVSKEFNISKASSNFDCEIIREYREIRASDVQLKLVSNRDLILKLGLGFEEMGQEVINQIKNKDPLFYLYYQSLHAIEESPLN